MEKLFFDHDAKTIIEFIWNEKEYICCFCLRLFVYKMKKKKNEAVEEQEEKLVFNIVMYDQWTNIQIKSVIKVWQWRVFVKINFVLIPRAEWFSDSKLTSLNKASDFVKRKLDSSVPSQCLRWELTSRVLIWFV